MSATVHINISNANSVTIAKYFDEVGIEFGNRHEDIVFLSKDKLDEFINALKRFSEELEE